MAERARVAYLADSTVDPRMLDGLAAAADITLVVPRAVAVSTFQPDAALARVALGRGPLTYLLAGAWWLVRNRARYDVVVALDNVRAALAANAGGLLARRPVILQLGRPTVPYYRCRALRGRRSMRHRAGLLVLRAVVALNEALATAVGAISEHVVSLAAVHARRVERIPWYGVDASIYAPGPGRTRARTMLAVPHDVTLVLFRSRLAHEKDPETFLAAMAELRARGRDVAAFYVGGEYADFVAAAEAAGVPVVGRDHVDPRRELPLFYAAADVTVQASHAEGLGMSPLESLAVGTPIVVTGVGGLREVADEGRAGAIVTPRDARALAEAIVGVLDDPGAAAAMVDHGRRMIRARFDAGDAFEAWRALIAELARNGRRPARVRARVPRARQEAA